MSNVVEHGRKNTKQEALESANKNKIFFPIDDDCIVMGGKAYGDQTQTREDLAANAQAIAKRGIYDVSAYNSGAVFKSLQALLSSSNLSTLIPASVRCGGMSIRFIQSSVPNSDNKYVQYRLMATSFSTIVANWEGVDDELDKIYNGLQEEYNIDITAQQEVDYGIDMNGKWIAKMVDFIGTSYIIPVNSHINKISCKNTREVDLAISFLKDIDNMTIQNSAAHFVDGDTERIMVSANSLYERDVPSGTNYIVTTATNSSGKPYYMVDFVLYSESFDGLLKLNEKVDIISKDIKTVKDGGNIDISELPIVNAAIDYTNTWAPTQLDVAGKSIIIDTFGAYYTSITLICPANNTISFLKTIPSRFDVVSKAVFAEGENGRRDLPVGVNTLDIPNGTNYISIGAVTSTGTNISPTSIQIDNEYISGIKSIVRKEVKELISVDGQEINDGIIYLKNMPNLAPISDPLKTLASGECNVYHEIATGLVYVVCIEGIDHEYEAFDCCSLYVFSLTNPNNVKRYQFAQKIDDSKKCYTPNIVPIGKKQVRVFYSIQNEDSGYCYYRDFNFNTETFTEPQKAILSISGDLTNTVIDNSFHNGDILTGNIIRQFTIDNSGTTGSEVASGKFVYIQKITEIMADGYRYATLNCGESISYNLVLARTNDNFASIEFVAVTPFLTRYDCAVAGLNNKLYFVHRVAGDEYAATSGSALFTADITDLNNIVWSDDTKFAEGDSRTDCYQYKNKIYLMAGNYHSVSGKPMRISSSVWEGISDKPSDYTKVLEVNDSRGVQNPRVFRYGAGDYGVLMQNSPARIDYANGWTGQWQFKTAVCFVCSRIN